MVYLAHRVNQMKEGLNTPSPSGWVVELNILSNICYISREEDYIEIIAIIVLWPKTLERLDFFY